MFKKSSFFGPLKKDPFCDFPYHQTLSKFNLKGLHQQKATWHQMCVKLFSEFEIQIKSENLVKDVSDPAASRVIWSDPDPVLLWPSYIKYCKNIQDSRWLHLFGKKVFFWSDPDPVFEGGSRSWFYRGRLRIRSISTRIREFLQYRLGIDSTKYIIYSPRKCPFLYIYIYM